MNILYFILAFLIICVYICLILQSNDIFEILNVSVTGLKPEILFEKSPIVIAEPLVKPIDLTKTVFRYLYVKKQHLHSIPSDTFQKVKCRYLLIYPRISRTKNHNNIVQIVHPHKGKYLKYAKNDDDLTNVEYVDVILDKRQVLILPIYWWYKTNSEYFGAVEIYDSLSYLFGFL